MRNWFATVGLVICTIFLLVVSIAFYDLILAFTTYLNLFGVAVQEKSGISSRQLAGQFLFCAILLLTYYFDVANSEKIEAHGRRGAEISLVSLPRPLLV
jgi:hypothetical protein